MPAAANYKSSHAAYLDTARNSLERITSRTGSYGGRAGPGCPIRPFHKTSPIWYKTVKTAAHESARCEGKRLPTEQLAHEPLSTTITPYALGHA